MVQDLEAVPRLLERPNKVVIGVRVAGGDEARGRGSSFLGSRRPAFPGHVNGVGGSADQDLELGGGERFR